MDLAKFLVEVVCPEMELAEVTTCLGRRNEKKAEAFASMISPENMALLEEVVDERDAEKAREEVHSEAATRKKAQEKKGSRGSKQQFKCASRKGDCV